MNRTTLQVILIAVLVAGLAFLGWQMMQLGEQVSTLQDNVEKAENRAGEAEARATEAETRAVKAEAAASEAGSAAVEAAEQATVAKAREAESSEKAARAEAEREAALERERLEARARAEAETALEKKEREAREAEEARIAAEKREAEAAHEATVARAEAREAKAEAEKIRQRMERELDRLARALGKIATTRREALSVVMTLDSSQIEFDFDKATLRPENREILSRIAGVLSTFDNYAIQIFGHTDDVGSVDYNLDLSRRRAETVKKYMAEAGIEDDAMKTTGLGKSDPLVEGTDPESRQRNRRVELAIVFSDAEFATTIPGSSPAADPPSDENNP